METLFADAKVLEYRIQHVFHVDRARHFAHRLGGIAQFLRTKDHIMSSWTKYLVKVGI